VYPLYTTPITINQKNILFSMVHDVTERKEAERLLLESETRLKLALEGAKEGTWDWNIKTGKVIFDNYWAEMLGYELSDISPNVTSWEELLHPEDREIVFDCLRKHLNGDTEVYQMEHRMKTKSGKWKWILGHGKVIERNEIGEALRAIGTHVDIDIYKVAHEELRIVSEELKNSNATKDKFFSIISHDLRGPIGNINSLLELITNTESKLSEEEYSEFMGIVKSSTKNAYILLENLLVWSRSQKGQIEFNPFKYNIHDLIKANINLFIISAKNKKISITSSVDKNVFAYFDFDMMNTVIRNLIGNAIKYTNQNGKILISTREESEFTEIIIQDNGIGMSEAIVQSLFRIDLKQPSIQGTNGEKGSRLGLILCKEFLDKHKGYIGVKSEPNKGTEFVVRLYSPTVK
jgi:PAS domain S-box-containing protein